MRKLIITFFIVCILLLLPYNTNAATKADVISAINATYTVNDETYRLPPKVIALGVEYLNSKELSSSQYSSILNYISQAVELARNAGTTNYKKLSDKDKKKALEIIYSVSIVAEVDLDKELSKNNININDKVNNGAETIKSELLSNPKDESELKAPLNQQDENKSEVSLKQQGENKSEVITNQQTQEDKSNTLQSSQYENNQEDNQDLNNISGENNEKANELNNTEDTIENNEIIISDEFKELFKEADKKVDITILFLTISIIIIFIILFFIFILILRLKKCNILKCILLCIISLCVVCIVAITAGLFIFKDELRLVIKLYYILQ